MSYSRATGPSEFLPAQINANSDPSVLLKGFLFVLLVLTAGCSATQHSSIDAPPVGESSPVIDAGSPPSINTDRDLATTLDQLLTRSDFSQARWGVALISLRDGKLIYQHNGD